MFFNCEDFKCNKIFRPWDNSTKNLEGVSRIRSEDSAQDATISTTTGNDDNQVPEMKEQEPKKTENTKVTQHKTVLGESSECDRTEKNCNRLEFRTSKNFETFPSEDKLKFAEKPELPPVLHDYSSPYKSYPLYPEFIHANLAHSLGLNPSDPLFLESMAQGCSIEEYARVLSQEHQSKLLSTRKQRPKKYKCPHCEVGFSNNGQLKGHIRIHTGERPFHCDETNCGKTFTRNEELTRHKRIHSGLRPFACTHCGKRFGRKDHLKKHSRTHFQPRGLYAVPVMLPFDTWGSSTPPYPYIPMFGY